MLSFAMHQAGFVLAGGKSSRMGTDKALLPFKGRVLIQHLAQIVKNAAGSATIIGDPEKYRGLGFPVIADRVPGRGPLSGIDAALSPGAAEWNLITACDLPLIPESWLTQLLAEAETRGIDALLSSTDRPEPLCAVYHRNCRRLVESALNGDNWKVTDALKTLRVDLLPVPDPGWLANANTPEEWRLLLGQEP